MNMELSAKERLIFALDVPDRKSALELVDLLEPEVGLFKMGLELYLSEGQSLLGELAGRVSCRIFLDLKLYDIPATLMGALSATRLHGVQLTTLPADIGPTGLKKVVSQIGANTTILAVTVLTSMSPEDIGAVGFEAGLARDPEKLVVHKALMAQKAGCHGVVCSGREAKAVRKECGDKDIRGDKFLIVCPGIRPESAKVRDDDQSRIVTPAQAIRNGADFIVVGRPIRTAEKPVDAARQVVAEIRKALEGRGK
jgi:orotidine-5'-phosphate decarboxylase